MQEAKGVSPQGSVRRQQQQQQRQQKAEKQELSSTRVATAAAAAATTAVSDRTKGSKSEAAAAVSSSARRPGAMSMSASGTTRRWGYRRGPREQLRRNLFGRFAPVFFYPLAQVSCPVGSRLDRVSFSISKRRLHSSCVFPWNCFLGLR